MNCRGAARRKLATILQVNKAQLLPSLAPLQLVLGLALSHGLTLHVARHIGAAAGQWVKCRTESPVSTAREDEYYRSVTGRKGVTLSMESAIE